VKSQFIFSLCCHLVLVAGAPERQVYQSSEQKGMTHTNTPRPLPPMGPYFHELAEQARKTGHVYDRVLLFSEFNEVMAREGGSVVPGCYKTSETPVGGYDSWEQAYKDLAELFQKGDAHAGYLLESPSSIEIAHKRGDPYATMRVLGPRTGFKRTPDQIKEAEAAISKLETLAEKGDRQAMFVLAGSIVSGKNRADRWYEKMKEQPDRLTYKAMYYRSAYGFPRNGKLLIEAAEHGEARAMSNLAEHFYYGNMPYTGLAMTDLEKAWFWLRKFRKAVGCPPPDEEPPIDLDTGKPWRKPKSKQSRSTSDDAQIVTG